MHAIEAQGTAVSSPTSCTALPSSLPASQPISSIPAEPYIDVKNIDACIAQLRQARKEARATARLAEKHIVRLQSLRAHADAEPYPDHDRYYNAYQPYQNNLREFSKDMSSAAELVKGLHKF